MAVENSRLCMSRPFRVKALPPCRQRRLGPSMPWRQRDWRDTNVPGAGQARKSTAACNGHSIDYSPLTGATCGSGFSLSWLIIPCLQFSARSMADSVLHRIYLAFHILSPFLPMSAPWQRRATDSDCRSCARSPRRTSSIPSSATTHAKPDASQNVHQRPVSGICVQHGDEATHKKHDDGISFHHPDRGSKRPRQGGRKALMAAGRTLSRGSSLRNISSSAPPAANFMKMPTTRCTSAFSLASPPGAIGCCAAGLAADDAGVVVGRLACR